MGKIQWSASGWSCVLPLRSKNCHYSQPMEVCKWVCAWVFLQGALQVWRKMLWTLETAMTKAANESFHRKESRSPSWKCWIAVSLLCPSASHASQEITVKHQIANFPASHFSSGGTVMLGCYQGNNRARAARCACPSHQCVALLLTYCG